MNKDKEQQAEKSQAVSSAPKEKIQIRRRKKGSIGRKVGKISAYKKYAEKGFEYRFVKGEEARLLEMEEQDWEKTTNEKGEVITQVVGKFEDGKPRYDVLMRKKKEWFDEDKAEAQALVDEQERELMRGTNKSVHADTLEADKMYIPIQDGKAENRIERRILRKISE